MRPLTHLIASAFVILAFAAGAYFSSGSESPSSGRTADRSPLAFQPGLSVRQQLALAAGRDEGVPDVPSTPRQPFGFADVQRIAQERAARPYESRPPELPKGLEALTYDQYRDIRFRPERALWRGESLFEVQFFHRGSSFREQVNISEVTPKGVRAVPYNPAFFNFGAVKPPPGLSPRLGYAGFRVHFPLHTPNYKDELIVFLGASYFRVLGRNQIYGLSARGLAIDTGSPDGEEFPRFTDFWLEKPQPADRRLIVYALLDSESVTGAYRFEIEPGGTTRVHVTSELYPRKAIEKLGVAPLTSMFLFGEDPAGRRFDDFRPEVHDSDGLLTQTGWGGWLWRPLTNPPELRISRLMDEKPRGFGLIQRDRDFTHYEDNEARYHRRPSYWVEPVGDWGRGGVELVEIPANEEIHDNIVAYWVPETRVEPGKPLRFAYRLSAFSRSPLWPPGGYTVATRTGDAAVGGYSAPDSKDMRRFVVDFAGGDLEGLDPTQPVKAVVKGTNAQIDTVTVERLADSNTWRVAFRVRPEGNEAVDLSCHLTLYDEALTETWTYLWNPP